MTRPKVVQFRPDMVTIEYSLLNGGGRYTEASRRAEGAAAGQWVSWRPSDLPALLPADGFPVTDSDAPADGISICYGRTRGALTFRTPYLRGRVTPRAVEVTAGAVACAMLGLDDLAGRMAELAAWWGELDDMLLRRFDMAADISDFPIESIGPADFQGTGGGKARVVEALSVTRYHRSGVCTGYTVAPGNAVKLNIYDKLAELRLPSSEHKAEMEFAAWRASGWDGDSPVTRVEVQLRTRPARELGITPADLGGNIDAMWQYITQQWMRLTDGTATRRSRAKPCAGWLAVQGATYRGAAQPAQRVRARSGPTDACTLGVVRSYAAARGELPEDPSIEALLEVATRMLGEDLKRKHGDGLPGYLEGRHDNARSTYGGGNRVGTVAKCSKTQANARDGPPARSAGASEVATREKQSGLTV